MRLLAKTLVSLSITVSLAACGGSTPAEEPAAPEPPMESAPPPPAAEEPAAEEAPAEPKEEPKPSRTAKDIITAPDTLFVFSFDASDPYKEAEEKCAKAAGEDAKKKSDCLTKAAAKLQVDDVAFSQEEDKWWYLRIKRKGDKLTNVHKIEVEFANDSEKSITLKPKGKDKGSKPMGKLPEEVVIEVPSESQIVMKDDKLGKLVFEAKIGLMGAAAPAEKAPAEKK